MTDQPPTERRSFGPLEAVIVAAIAVYVLMLLGVGLAVKRNPPAKAPTCPDPASGLKVE